MRILFVNPPFLKKFSRSQRSPAVTKSGTLYYPMWLSYAAGFAEQGGHEIELIDAPADGSDVESVLNRARTFLPKLIVVETSTPSIYNDIGVCAQLKERLPEAFILLVGTHVSALSRDTMELSESIDAIAVGEYDETVNDLANAIDGKRDIRSVKGICFRNPDTIECTEARPFLEDLDKIPFVSSVYKKHLNVEHYFNPNALYPMITITTSRGCPFHCIFCVYPQTLMGHRVRTRSVENVVDEIEFVVRTFPGVKAIFFEDDTFTAIKKRCVAISERIVERQIRISWSANARADLDYETMQVMRRAGCRCLCVGFESGSQKLLENIKKRITLEKMNAFMENARKAGILVHGCFIVGLPGETKETMKETLDLAKRLNPDTVQFYPIMLYPGTEAYRWYKERDLLTTNDFSSWLTPGGLHNTVVRTADLMADELVRFCDDARRAFYLRPRYLFYKLKQVVTHPGEFRRNVKSLRTFIAHLLKGSDISKAETCACK